MTSTAAPTPAVSPFTGGAPSSPDQASRLRELVRQWRDTAEATAAPEQPATPRCPVVTITSGKGGVGKTNLSVNLAIALSQLGCRVTLLDADLGLANADVLCGLTPTTRLDSVLDGPSGDRRTLRQLAVAAPAGVRLIPGAVGLPRIAELAAPQRDFLVRQLVDIESDSDVVLVDTGAGIGASVLAFVAAANLALVVSTPEPTAITDAYAMVKAAIPLQRHGARIGLVVNQSASVGEAEATHARIAGVAERFLNMRPEYLGSVRRDEAVPRSVRARSPFLLACPRAGASEDVRRLARGLRERLGLQATLPITRPEGFWARVWRPLSVR
ncbi:MAG: MinD/ParA family protein [Phycisphaerales bacterium]